MSPEHIVDFQTHGRRLVMDTFPWARLMRQSEGIDTVEAEIDPHIFIRLTCNRAQGSGELYTNDAALGKGTLAEEELDPNEWSDFQGWMGVAFQTYADARNSRLLIVNTTGMPGHPRVFLKPHVSSVSFDGGAWNIVFNMDTLHKLVFGLDVSPSSPPPSPVFQNGVREMVFKHPTNSRTKLASVQQPDLSSLGILVK